MTVLWEYPQSTVGDVVDHMTGPVKPAYNSVLTILRILERKGYVTHEKSGRAFTYSPVLDRMQARRGALSQLLSRFFNGSREMLVMDLLGHEEVSEAQLEKVRELLDSAQAGAAVTPARAGAAGATPARKGKRA